MISAKETAEKQRLRFEMRRKDPKEVYGIPTGIETLDKMTGGILRKETYQGKEIGDNSLIALIAGTGVGKSSLAGQIGLHVAGWFRDNEPDNEVRMYAGEMSPELYQERLMSNLAGVPLKRIQTGMYISKEQEEKYYEALKIFQNLPIRYVESANRMEDLANELLKVVDGKKCGFFIIDYLGITPGISAENKVSTIGHNANIIHRMVKKYSPGLVLAQVNKEVEKRSDKRPMITDVQYDSVLSHASTVFLGLYMPSLYENVAVDMKINVEPVELAVHKNRLRGETGIIDMSFIRDRGVWKEVSK